MLELIRFYIWRILVKVTKRLRIFMIVDTNVGLKNLNFNLLIDIPSGGEIVYIDSNDLYLGPDYIVDKFTLLDCPLHKSPHYEFMKALSENGDIYQTDYFKRYINGKLDWRYVQNPKVDLEACFISKFYKAKESIIRSKYAPITVYSINKKYYILDGKHRAALCALYNTRVKCRLVPADHLIGKIGQYMFQCIVSKPQFSLHKEFFNLANHV